MSWRTHREDENGFGQVTYNATQNPILAPVSGES